MSIRLGFLARFGGGPYRCAMRLCSRTACAGTATASCAFSYGHRLVWIAPLDRDRDPSFYDLCEVHLETLRVPKGWSLEDRRATTVVDQPSLLA